MADKFVVNPPPKTRFQSSPDTVKLHRELMMNGNVQHALDTALLQYQFELASQNPDMAGAAASHFRMSGALQFVHLLKTLAEPPPQAPRTVDRDNLKH